MAIARRRRAASVTAQHVADRLGVSQSTVSRAFSNPETVSPQTRNRVLEAARSLGYQPNVIARSLITRRTNMIAVVIANLVDPFYPAILEELSRQIQVHGLQTLLFIAPDEARTDETLSSLLQYQVDGIVMASATLTSRMARVCAARDTPVVLFNRYVPGLKIRSVSCDNLRSGWNVAEYLAGTGHRRPLYVSGRSDATTSLDRLQGFTSAWKAMGVEECGHMDGGEYSYEAGYAAGRRIAAQKARPDCVFFASDVMALGGLEALRQGGVDVPQDISVVGFDDVPLAHWPSADLTTVRIPVRDMVSATLEMLALTEANSAPTKVKLFRGDLIIRGTTRTRSR